MDTRPISRSIGRVEKISNGKPRSISTTIGILTRQILVKCSRKPLQRSFHFWIPAMPIPVRWSWISQQRTVKQHAQCSAACLMNPPNFPSALLHFRLPPKKYAQNTTTAVGITTTRTPVPSASICGSGIRINIISTAIPLPVTSRMRWTSMLRPSGMVP